MQVFTLCVQAAEGYMNGYIYVGEQGRGLMVASGRLLKHQYQSDYGHGVAGGGIDYHGIGAIDRYSIRYDCDIDGCKPLYYT